MKVIVGLGNPGPEYERTRHNAGFLVVDRLARRHAPGAVPRARFHGLAIDAPTLGGERSLLVKPMTYMNRSGLCVSEAVRFYKVCVETDLLVIVDDAALPAGSIRLREKGGAGGHNGLIDIAAKLGTERFARLRVGIDPPGPAPQTDYVLGRFSPEQWSRVEPALERAADAAEVWAAENAVAAMNQFNAAEPDEASARSDRERSPMAGDDHTPDFPGGADADADQEDASR